MTSPWLGAFGRYLARTVLTHVAIAGTAGLVLFALVDAVELGNRLGPEVRWSNLWVLEVWGLPRMLRLILGLCAILGTLTATTTLSRRGEIFALLAAGGSPAVVLKPMVLVGTLLAAGHAGLTEWVVPPAQARVAEVRAQLGLPVRRGEILAKPSTWFRGADRFFRINDLGAEDGSVLVGVLMLRTKDGRLVERWDAERLEWDGASWTAAHIVHRRFRSDRILERVRHAVTPLPLRERPEDFVRRIGLASRQRLIPLIDTIRARHRLGQNTVGHRLELGRRATTPLLVLLGAVLGGGVALSFGRRPTLAHALAAGAVIGLAIWVLEEVTTALATTGAVAPETTVLVTPLLLGTATAGWWWRTLRTTPGSA